MQRIARVLGHLETSQHSSAATAEPCAARTPHQTVPRNPGIPLDVGWVNRTQVNMAALKARAADHLNRRAVKKSHQLGWLLRCLTIIDLTTLSGSDSPTNVERLARKARNPLRRDMLDKLQLDDHVITTGAVCVYPNMVKHAVKALQGSGVGVASVAAGFPAGQTALPQRLNEIRDAVASGASEIDIVIPREHAISGRWDLLYDEVKAMREACGDAKLKTILAVGDLPTYTHVYKASLVSMMAGSDFIKTSTGKESANASIPVGLVMIRALREYHEATGYKVGFKPAGGISTAKAATQWMALMLEELGEEWTHPHLFRIGASSLLLDIERQIEHGLTGQYAAKHYMPLA
jgi:deoxyribose-phosphate aldolase